MAAVSNTSTRQTGAAYIPRILSDYIVKVREANLQAAKFVTRRDMDVAAFGQTVDFPVDSDFTIYNYADGNRLTDNLASNIDTVVTLTVSQVPMRPFLVLDTLSVQAKADYKALKMKRAGYIVAKTIDSSVLSEGLKFSANTIQNEGTPSTAVTLAQLIACQATLDKLDVPEEDRVWFLYAQVLQDMMGLTGNYFSSLDFADSKSLVKGQISQLLLGSPVVKTTNLPTGTAGSPVTTYRKNMYFHKSAIALATQKDVEYQEEYELDLQGTLCNARSMYGTATLRANHGVLLYR